MHTHKGLPLLESALLNGVQKLALAIEPFSVLTSPTDICVEVTVLTQSHIAQN